MYSVQYQYKNKNLMYFSERLINNNLDDRYTVVLIIIEIIGFYNNTLVDTCVLNY